MLFNDVKMNFTIWILLQLFKKLSIIQSVYWKRIETYFVESCWPKTIWFWFLNLLRNLRMQGVYFVCYSGWLKWMDWRGGNWDDEHSFSQNYNRKWNMTVIPAGEMTLVKRGTNVWNHFHDVWSTLEEDWKYKLSQRNFPNVFKKCRYYVVNLVKPMVKHNSTLNRR